MICTELRALEPELREEKNSRREEILHFLNELGWFFQRKDASLDPNYSLKRFKFLFTFSAERDWCYLVKKLLDIIVESNFEGRVPMKKSLEVLSEVQLLNRAVRRGCTKMVELLINYAVNRGPDASRTYIFPPDVAGPDGFTPLHLAACTSGSTGIIDALTGDPQEVLKTCNVVMLLGCQPAGLKQGVKLFVYGNLGSILLFFILFFFSLKFIETSLLKVVLVSSLQDFSSSKTSSEKRNSTWRMKGTKNRPSGLEDLSVFFQFFEKKK